MMMNELGSLLSYHSVLCSMSALAMQSIVFFCNLQQQPTCIKNMKGIDCSADPL